MYRKKKMCFAAVIAAAALSTMVAPCVMAEESPAVTYAAGGEASASELQYASAEALASAAAAVNASASSNTFCQDECLTWKEQGDGTARLYSIDTLTGEEKLFEGWYTDFDGNKFYYEKGKAASGWIIDNGKFYYFEPKTGIMAVSRQVGNFYVGEDGAALIDTTAPDGTKLAFNGSRMTSNKPIEKLDDKVYIYRELLVKNPDLYAEFSQRPTGSYQIVPEKANGFSWYTYAFMRLYERNADGSMGSKLYEGDGCFRSDAAIEYLNEDGTVSTMRPAAIIGSGHETWMADHIHIDPAGYISYSFIKK